MNIILTIVPSFVNLTTTSSSKKKITLFKCSFCKINSDDVWTTNNNSILCCKSCWGNNPIIARAMNGKKLIKVK